MKSVLISIQPKWCEKIANGEKTIEVRKTAPKLKPPFKCYIYCTQPKYPHEDYIVVFDKPDSFYAGGKVIGEFVCDSIERYEAELQDDKTFERIQELYEPADFAEYGEYEYRTIADNSDDFWEENILCKSACMSVDELRKYVGTGIHYFYGWHISNLKIYDRPITLREFERWSKDGERPCNKGKYCQYDYYDYSEECRACAIDYDGTDCPKMKLTRPPQSWCYVQECAT